MLFDRQSECRLAKRAICSKAKAIFLASWDIMNMVLFTQTDTHLYMCSTFSFLKDSCWSLLLLFKTHIRITNFVNKTHKIVSSPMRFHDGAHSLCFCSFDINHSVSSSAAAVAVMCVSTTIPYTVAVIAVDFFSLSLQIVCVQLKRLKKKSHGSTPFVGSSWPLCSHSLSILLHSHFLSVQLDFDLLR